ncbi:MAG TPA: tripartite tricarboxylate transporter substrate binding protein [Opitutaceae bacterium]|nr:tripartite tricarboxylate transporter substrate binding protein [Opitutaceae bacterium]
MIYRGLAAVATALLCATCAAADAPATDAYPTRPVRMIVAQAAGGNADIVARAFAAALSDRLQQSIVVDNRPGASGIIATEIAVKSPPDGYTLLLVSSAFGVNPAVRSKLPYDQLRDLAPITLIGKAPNVLVVGPALNIRSVEELIKAAKANPGQITYGSSGVLGSTHLAGELFDLMTGTKMVHVPYKGAAPALLDVISGRVSLSFASLPSAIGHMRSGRLRGVAVTSEKRFPLLPELPTVAESGLPGFETNAWQGLAVPARTPAAIVKRLNAEAVQTLRQPAIRQHLANDGAEVVASTPEEFWTFARSQIAKWTKVVKAAGLKEE